MIRNIIEIDREKCIGCSACANTCHQGAIAMVDGKAKLMSEDHCDGLGRCLPNCPADAIKIIEKDFPLEVKDPVEIKKPVATVSNISSGCPSSEAKVSKCGCPSSTMKTFDKVEKTTDLNLDVPAELNQWPCQIKLVNPAAPYFNNADLLIAADCCSFAYGNFHNEFMKGKITIIGCPKLDDVDYSEKLAAILSHNNINSITLTRMSVPCCGGMTNAVEMAVRKSGKDIPINIHIISTDGKIQK